MTELPPHELIQHHITTNSALTALFFSDRDATDIVATSMGRLLMIKPRADEVEIRAALLRHVPALHIHSQLRDAHLYIFKRWVVDLALRTKAVSIKEDIIPLLIEMQYRPELRLDKMPEFDLLPAFAISTSGVFPDSNVSESQKIICTPLLYKDGYTARLDSVAKYCDANRAIVKSLHEDSLISVNAEINPKTQAH